MVSSLVFLSLLSGVFLHDRGAAVDPVPEGSSLLQNEGLSGISYWYGEDNLIHQRLQFHTLSINCASGVSPTNLRLQNECRAVCSCNNLMGNVHNDIPEHSLRRCWVFFWNIRDMWDYWVKKEKTSVIHLIVPHKGQFSYWWDVICDLPFQWDMKSDFLPFTSNAGQFRWMKVSNGVTADFDIHTSPTIHSHTIKEYVLCFSSLSRASSCALANTVTQLVGGLRC